MVDEMLQNSKFLLCFIFTLYEVLFLLYMSYFCYKFCYVFIIYLCVYYMFFELLYIPIFALFGFKFV